MADDVSFSSLFRRSRYARSEALGGAEDGDKQERKELFAVAAVAFTMKYEPAFKRHFLEKICGTDSAENLDEYEVGVQPYDFDLHLLNVKRKEVIVVEFKVDAKLQSHQDFERSEFFSPWDEHGSREGYGRQMKRKYGKDCRSLKYVVLLQKSDRDSLSKEPVLKRGIECSSRVWSDLLYDRDQSEPQLVTDLLDWLAQHVVELNHRIYAKMNKSRNTDDAVQMYQILAGVLAKPLNSRKPSINANQADGEAWFGANIPKTCKGFDTLKKYAETKPSDALAWFGYYRRRHSEPKLEVWIYLSSPRAKELAPLVSKQLGGGAKVEADELNNLVISCSDSKLGDMEWFKSVFSKLKSLPRL